MSKLDDIFDDNFDPIRYTDDGGETFYVNMEASDAKQAIKDLFLELINETDPANAPINTKYWGNVLRKKIEEL